jgi:hypothetical protein
MPSPGEAAADLPSPGEVARPAAAADIPAPGEVKRPDIPAPGEVRKPVDIPAPGEVFVPQPAAPVAAKPKDLGGDPMVGGAAFNPDVGLIVDSVGEIKGRGGFCLPLFAGVVGILIGAVLGWMAHKTTDLYAR